MNNYYKTLKNNLKTYKKTHITLNSLYQFIDQKALRHNLNHPEGYRDFTSAVKLLISENILEEIKSSGSFDMALETLNRLNVEVQRKLEKKNKILDLMVYGGSMS